MTSLKTVSLLLVVIAALLVVSGSGAFSSAEVERSVDVSVVGDKDAFLALEFEDEPVNLSEDGDVKLFTVTNQFSEDLETLEVTATEESDIDDENIDVETDLGSGERSEVTTDYACDTDGDGPSTAEFEIFADTGSESVDAVRSVNVTCNS